jgi:ABC-type dipeptide/oligopeptide/nickel transport system permease subunit
MGASMGGVLLIVVCLLVIFAPLLTPYDPIKQNFRDILVGPNPTHWLGTDNYGRDVWSRILYGGQISLTMGSISVVIGAVIGVALGLVSGYYGGMSDGIIMRFMDAMLAFPGILMAITVVAILGSSLNNVMIAVGISSIPGFARLARGSVLSAKENEYVFAARVAGCRSGRIMLVHILPNIFAPLLTYSTLRVSTSIIAASSLSFLGLGAQRPTPEWGVMLSDGREYMRQYWWLSMFPGLAIMITALSINMLGDGLRDALDPRLRRAI